MRSARVAAVATVAATSLVLLTGGVAVAAPANDTYQGRTVIGSVPFVETADTSTATTDGDDTELNAVCGAPATDASVWYEYTATTDGAVIVDVSGSSYSAGVLVGTGGPGAWNLVTCGPGAVILPTSAGQTYAILAIDDQLDSAGNGGMLSITVIEAPPPPVIDITVDPFGHVDQRTGNATIQGTVTCTGNSGIVLAELRQPVGRFTIIGNGFVSFGCDGQTHPWSAEVVPFNGKFAGGKSASVTMARSCGEFSCSFDYEERQVQLRH